MKEISNIEELSREEMIQVIRQLKVKIDEMERERSIVGESLIRANRIGEMIQEKAESQAKEILAAAEVERKKILDGVDNEKVELTMEIQKMKQIRVRVVAELQKIVEKYTILLEKEQENLARVEEAELAMESVPTVSSVPEEPRMETIVVPLPEQASFAAPEVDVLPPVVLPEISDDVPEISSDIDLTSMLLNPEPAAPVVEAQPVMEVPSVMDTPAVPTPVTPEPAEVDLNSLLASMGTAGAPMAPVAPVAPVSAEDEMRDFVAGLQENSSVSEEQVDLTALLNTPVVETAPAAPTAMPVNLDDLLNSAAPAVPAPVPPVQVSETSISDILNNLDSTPQPVVPQISEPVDLNQLINGSAPASDNSFVDVTDLLK